MILFACTGIQLQAQSVASIPMYHPVYQDLRYLKTLGYFPDLDLTNLPLSRMQVTKAIYNFVENNRRVNNRVLRKVTQMFSNDVELYRAQLRRQNMLVQGLRKLLGKSDDTNKRPLTLGLRFQDNFQGPDPWEIRGGVRTLARVDFRGYASVVNSMVVTNNRQPMASLPPSASSFRWD